MEIDNVNKVAKTFELLDTLRQHTTTLRRELSIMSRSYTAGNKSVASSTALVALIAMKAVNRDAQILAESCQDDVVHFVDAAERKRLELANLEYERETIRTEVENSIKKMEDGHLADILRALEDEQTPKKRRKKTKKDHNEIQNTKEYHENMLERLNAELNKRETMMKDVEALRLKKAKLEANIKAGKSFLKDVPAKVQTIYSTVKSLRTFFGENDRALATDLTNEEASMLKSLPAPLYVFFREAHGYKGAYKNIDVSIERSENFINTSMSVDSASERDLHTPHPCCVCIQFPTQDASENSSGAIRLKVYYFPLLHLVACSLHGEQWIDTRTLSNLFPNDPGDESPNPSNSHLLSGEFRYKRSLAGGARPFLWINIVCGLRYIKPRSIEDSPDSAANWPETATSFPTHVRFSTIIDAIKSRILTRRALVKELQNLEKCDLVEASRELGMKEMPKTNIKSWQAHRAGQDSGLNEYPREYEVEFVNGDYGISGLVCVRGEYPHVIPVVRISESKSRKCPPEFDEMQIRGLEKEVNTTESTVPLLLSRQLLNVMAAFDLAVGNIASKASPRLKKGRGSYKKRTRKS